MADIYTPTVEERKSYAQMAVVILTPFGSYDCPARFARSVGNMIAYSWMQGLKVYQWGGAERTVVHWARNQLCRLMRGKINEYTGKPFTHILWLDDDHVFNPDLAVYLARHKDLDVVSALYFGRVGRHLPVAYVKDETADKYMHYPIIEVPPTLCQVDAVGLGACLMRADVLERVPEPWFKFEDAGEDIYFCVHAKEHGVEIYCDGSYALGHIGEPQIVTMDTYKQYLKANETEFADRIKVPLGGTHGRDNLGSGQAEHGLATGGYTNGHDRA